MYKYFALAVLVFVAVSAEPDHTVAPFGYQHAAYPHNYGAYQPLDAYKHHPYSYDAAKYPYQHGAYPYAHHDAYQHGASAYPYTGYPQHYGAQPYHAAGHYPYSGIYNNAHLAAKV